MPSSVVSCDHAGWREPASPGVALGAVTALERGDVVLLPDVAFTVERDEGFLFTPAILSSSKNVSFNPSSGQVGGTTLDGEERDRLRHMLARFSGAAAALVDGLLPRYRGSLERGRSSFRPAEIAGRPTSWRKDDTRLHIDSFPTSPVRGRRILRVFANVNPAGRARSWRVGEEFEAVARRFSEQLSMPWPPGAWLLSAFRITKTRRSPYDGLMLQLHDCMKADAAYQRSSPQRAVEFPAGSTWIAFTDQVSHAAMAGQYQLEQTFYLPVGVMLDESRAPLRVLERLKGCPLV